MIKLHTYRGTVVKVYDGDTVKIDIDLGFHIGMKAETFRLNRINTPEVRGAERQQGLISRDWLRERIMKKDIVIRTHKDKKGKYGRWLADIYIDDVCINDELVDKGLAEYKSY